MDIDCDVSIMVTEFEKLMLGKTVFTSSYVNTIIIILYSLLPLPLYNPISLQSASSPSLQSYLIAVCFLSLSTIPSHCRLLPLPSLQSYLIAVCFISLSTIIRGILLWNLLLSQIRASSLNSCVPNDFMIQERPSYLTAMYWTVCAVI